MKKEGGILYRLMIRWGILAILVLMLAGIGVLLQVITISNKTEAELFTDSHSDEYVAYVTCMDFFNPVCGKTLEVDVPGKGQLFFRIVSVKKEPSFYVLSLKGITKRSVLVSSFGGNTKLSGYVFTEKVKLSSLIFSRWGL